MKENKAAKQQQKRLEEERKRAENEAAKLSRENQQKKDASARLRLGRSSLITTSELGVTDQLG